jgi:hypothetical protein
VRAVRPGPRARQRPVPGRYRARQQRLTGPAPGRGGGLGLLAASQWPNASSLLHRPESIAAGSHTCGERGRGHRFQALKPMRQATAHSCLQWPPQGTAAAYCSLLCPWLSASHIHIPACPTSPGSAAAPLAVHVHDGVLGAVPVSKCVELNGYTCAVRQAPQHSAKGLRPKGQRAHLRGAVQGATAQGMSPPRACTPPG